VLTVGVIEARKLPDRDTVGRQDPYVVLTLDGECRSFRQQTKVDTDGGRDPVWNQVFQFDVVDHFILKVELFDKDLVDKDDLIGRVDIPLLPLFKKGIRDGWVPVKCVPAPRASFPAVLSSNCRGARYPTSRCRRCRLLYAVLWCSSRAACCAGLPRCRVSCVEGRTMTKWGKEEHQGDIKLNLDFVGPPGIKYPQRQPEMDNFDDSERLVRGAPRCCSPDPAWPPPPPFPPSVPLSLRCGTAHSSCLGLSYCLRVGCTLCGVSSSALYPLPSAHCPLPFSLCRVPCDVCLSACGGGAHSGASRCAGGHGVGLGGCRRGPRWAWKIPSVTPLRSASAARTCPWWEPAQPARYEPLFLPPPRAQYPALFLLHFGLRPQSLRHHMARPARKTKLCWTHPSPPAAPCVGIRRTHALVSCSAACVCLAPCWPGQDQATSAAAEDFSEKEIEEAFRCVHGGWGWGGGGRAVFDVSCGGVVVVENGRLEVGGAPPVGWLTRLACVAQHVWCHCVPWLIGLCGVCASRVRQVPGP
jgi:hypothetical protein